LKGKDKMSAFICSNKHIEALALAWGKCNRIDSIEEIQKVADILKRENVKSVRARYGGPLRDLPGPLKKTKLVIKSAERTITDAVQLICLAHCLNYQSCETRTYEKSKARRIILELIYDLSHYVPGYDSAPWSII
jgi:hypothetical protein